MFENPINVNVDNQELDKLNKHLDATFRDQEIQKFKQQLIKESIDEELELASEIIETSDSMSDIKRNDFRDLLKNARNDVEKLTTLREELSEWLFDQQLKLTY